MSFVKNFLKMILFITLLVGGHCVYHYFSDLKYRQELKDNCQSDSCPCFYNIVDYRLTKEQARAFLNYLKARQLRPEAQILEFIDFQNAREITSLIGICQVSKVFKKAEAEVQESVTPEDKTDSF